MDNDNINVTNDLEQFLMEQERDVENIPLFKAATCMLCHHEDVTLVEVASVLSDNDRARMYHTLWCLFSQEPPDPNTIFRWCVKDEAGREAYDSLLEKMKKLEDELLEEPF